MSYSIVAAVAVAVVGTVSSTVSSNKARHAQEDAAKAQQKISSRQNQRERLKQIREKRIGIAQIEQSGATQGAGDSSSVQGGVASLGSTTNANIAFINQIEGLQQNIQRNLEAAGRYQGQAAAFGAIASLGGSIATAGGPTNTSSGLPDQFTGQNTGIAGSSNFVGPSRG